VTLTPDSDVRLLARAIVRECDRMMDADSDNCPTVDAGDDCVLSDAPRIASGLKAAVERAKHGVDIEKYADRPTQKDAGERYRGEAVIYAAARAMIERGWKPEDDND
jgi:hypothetical protein